MGKMSGEEKKTIIVAYDQALNTLEFRVCISGPSGVIQPLVRSMIPPFALHAAFCPVRVVIPSVNSNQPVRQQAKPQGNGTKGDIKGRESRLGVTRSPRSPTLDGRPRRPTLPFWQLWTQFGLSPRRVAWRSLRAKGMRGR